MTEREVWIVFEGTRAYAYQHRENAVSFHADVPEEEIHRYVPSRPTEPPAAETEDWLQRVFDGLISDLGDENFDPDGWMRDRIWEAIRAAGDPALDGDSSEES